MQLVKNNGFEIVSALVVLLCGEIIFSITASVLEITEIMDFSTLFYVSVILHFLGATCLVITFIIDKRKGYEQKYHLVCVGFFGFVIATILQIILYMQKTIEAKDTYTKGHSARVAKYASLLAEKIGLSKEKQNEIYYMGMLHDIGKIGITDSIINKPGKLTDEEYSLIKTHTDIGYRILKNMNEIKDIEYGARWYHERYDGKGYPDGLAGDQIPIYARVIAVADVYDAMTSNRSYRKVMPQSEVRAEIERVSGTQLDPDIAACMIQLIDEDSDYQLRQEIR